MTYDEAVAMKDYLDAAWKTFEDANGGKAPGPDYSDHLRKLFARSDAPTNHHVIRYRLAPYMQVLKLDDGFVFVPAGVMAMPPGSLELAPRNPLSIADEDQWDVSAMQDDFDW
ncbi:MAG: hypothetical protein JSS66_06260 [Armatimonadetes bacterium]|nr:hypothetical protein [Armatimonadota bacterium]